MRLALLPLLTGCAAAPDGAGDSADTADTAATCASSPVLTYDNFGRGFLTQNCQPCHASTAIDRHGADPDIVFDTEDDVEANWDLIVYEATGDNPAMPPSGGIVEAERSKLELWLTCGG